MRVRFWGTRGSIPAPGAQTVRFGGNTSCVELQTDDGTHIILDCGTGARELGEHLLRSEARPMRLHLFISHIHWDHIQGFPFFGPASLPDTELHVYAPRGFERTLEEAVAGQMQHTYFPVKLRDLPSHIRFTQLEEGFFRVGRVLVETQHLNHTAPTIGYRITGDGATVVYSTDHEPFWKPQRAEFRHPGDQRHLAFLDKADLVIHDAQYTAAEYPAKIGWGHSTVEYATDVCLAAGAQQLALFHHDPARHDAAIGELVALSHARIERRADSLQVIAAAEGLALDIPGHRQHREDLQLPAMVNRPIAGNCVLVVGSNETEWAAISEQLQEDDLIGLRAPDARVAAEEAAKIAPNLAIIDERVIEREGSAVIAALRTRSGRAELPIILLTRNFDTAFAHDFESVGITDYLAKPFSAPMLGARVRAWLSRASAGPAWLAPPAQRAGQSEAAASQHLRVVPPMKGRIGRELASLSLFRSLTRGQIDFLSRRATEQVFGAGRAIVEQGKAADQIFVMLSGRTRVVERMDDLGGTELFLGELGPGDIFGETAILTGRRRSATVQAAEPTRCLAFSADDFLRVMWSAPELAGRISQVLAQRIYRTDRRMAHYAPDPLTGLLNRRAFADKYPRFATVARHRHTGVVLLMLDITNLKAVNDEFGYGVGDDVIRTVADSLMETLKTPDTAARWGGDEFVLLTLESRRQTVEGVAKRVSAQLTDFATQRGLPIALEQAIGVAIAPDPPDSVDDLIRIADADLHRRLAPSRQRRAARRTAA